MKSFETWLRILSGSTVVGAAIAVYDLFTGWTLDGGVLAAVVVLGLFLGALGAMTAAVVIAFVDRMRIKALVEAPPAKASLVAARARWTSLLAVGFAILMFANCSGAVGNNGHQVAGAMSDAARYWPMATGLLLPTVVLLALAGLMATLAEGKADGRWANGAIFASCAAAVVAFFTAPIALVLGVSACEFGTRTGTCAAGVGGIANAFTIAALALSLPYLTLLPAFIPGTPKIR